MEKLLGCVLSAIHLADSAINGGVIANDGIDNLLGVRAFAFVGVEEEDEDKKGLNTI